MIPKTHQTFITRAKNIFFQDDRFVGLLGAGSQMTGQMDEFSDVDLVAVYRDGDTETVLESRMNILNSLGDLLSAFTGEHVGDPRVLICLYQNPLLHVDVKFVSLSELKKRVENPVIIFEKENLITTTFRTSSPLHPAPDLQWIEDRIWTWIHYMALRLGRGELFEVIDCLSFIRGSVLGPLALMNNGELPRGVRRIELKATNYSQLMEKTIPSYSRDACISAIEATIELYKKLKSDSKKQLVEKTNVEEAAITYFTEISRR